jgi:acetyl esterase/lipase
MRGAVLAVLVLAAAVSPAAEEPPVKSAADAVALPRPAADHRLSYGSDPLQFGELRLPPGPGPHPVAVVIHGGCWLAEYDLGYVSALAAALAEAGVATWSVEYRRVGNDGGGWPGTFADLAAAADHLRALAATHALDLGRVAAVGHSAGGHLALWLAARHRLAAGDPLRGPSPLPLAGVVALAGIPDLATYASPDGCGAAVAELLGDEPGAVPDRLRRASPAELLPLGLPCVLVVGELDTIVPPRHAEAYAAAAAAAGDQVRVLSLPDAGHFELVAPGSAAWPAVRDAVLGIVAGDP